MEQIFFNVTEALHLVALFFCVFIIGLLLMFNHFAPRIIVPMLFFLALSSTFLAGLNDRFFSAFADIKVFLVWAETLQPALCFLLVVQLWRDQVPRAYYWLILALPMVGGSALVVASMQLDDVCLLESYCLETYELRALYLFFATAMILLLLIVHLSRIPIASNAVTRYQSHRYWLMIALILSYAALMLVDLFSLTHHITATQHERIHVIMRLCFMYLVTTSLFRLFDARGSATTHEPKPVDAAVVTHIITTLERGKLYREMNFNREQFARKLEIPEHLLSRAINQEIGKNFNEFINGYRIAEAKQRLASETTSVTAIAFEVGFSSIASFNRVFKAMVGQSPTEYRQLHSKSLPL